MLLNKQNVFDDFIARGRVPDRRASGRRPRTSRSAAARTAGCSSARRSTQRPELFRAVICARAAARHAALPPLRARARPGSPSTARAEDPEQFKALHALLAVPPRVDAGPRAYPAMLFDSADHDDRVDPMHARKLAARAAGEPDGRRADTAPHRAERRSRRRRHGEVAGRAHRGHARVPRVAAEVSASREGNAAVPGLSPAHGHALPARGVLTLTVAGCPRPKTAASATTPNRKRPTS